MLLAAMSYWAVGFGLAYGLGFGVGLGAPGVWMGLAAGLLCAATLLSGRFDRLTRRRYLPPPPA
jgi:MATE family multidrug resistance protein